MEQPLYRLVYYSRNTVPQDMFETEVHGILAHSRVNNTRDGITGALLFNGGCFAQVLEGPLAPVEAAFERIQQDPRHGEVSLLAFEPTETRSFSNWAMGFLGAEESPRFAAVGIATGFDPAHLDGEQIHATLKELMLDEEAA